MTRSDMLLNEIKSESLKGISGAGGYFGGMQQGWSNIIGGIYSCSLPSPFYGSDFPWQSGVCAFPNHRK